MSIVNSILKIFVGDKSANDIKAIQPIVNKINSYQEALKSISLTIGESEIVAIAGVAGNGQRELAEVISGMRPATRGTIAVNSEVVPNGRVRKAMTAGISHVPEDRLHTGLVADHSIEDNLILKSYRGAPISKMSVLRRRIIRAQAKETIQKYDVKTPDTITPIRLLSGGNVQKVLLARELSGGRTATKLLVVCSPTRGLDVGAIETVRALLDDARSAGQAILLISEDLDEVMSLSDRVFVLYRGSVVHEAPGESAELATVGAAMAGLTPEGKS